MKENKIKKLELNTKKLENFDKIISTKLDEVEELKVTELDQGSELLNIISLCANVKTLILEGDQRLNTDKILTNVFKPENVENLVLNNVKLPTNHALKKYTNLKRISLKDIRFSNIKDFFAGMVNPHGIEMIGIFDTDMRNQSMNFLEKFINLKHLRLKSLKNSKLDGIKFVKNVKNLAKVDILDNSIEVAQLKYLINGKWEKNIAICIINSNGTVIGNCKLNTQANISELSILVNRVEEVESKINCKKIKKINIVVNQIVRRSYFIEFLKKVDCEMQITIYDFSCLNSKQASKIKNILGIEKLEFVNQKEITKLEIETYLEIRQEIEFAIEQVSSKLSEPEKFLKIYQYLGTEFEISEEPDIPNGICTTFQITQLLQECLKCVKIDSNIIFGEEFENNEKHCWNQVKLEGKWYNTDISLDMENIKKNNPEYCLLGDQEFFDTHVPKSGKNNYCAENFNTKLIHVFFKTGLFKENLIGSYIEIMLEKLKRLFRFNKNIGLPEARIDEDKED